MCARVYPATQSCRNPCDPVDCSTPDSSSVGFPRQEYWTRLPFPSRASSTPGITPAFPALAGGFFTSEPPGKPCGVPCWPLHGLSPPVRLSRGAPAPAPLALGCRARRPAFSSWSLEKVGRSPEALRVLPACLRAEPQVCRLESLEGRISCRNQCREQGSDCPCHGASKQPVRDEVVPPVTSLQRSFHGALWPWASWAPPAIGECCQGHLCAPALGDEGLFIPFRARWSRAPLQGSGSSPSRALLVWGGCVVGCFFWRAGCLPTTERLCRVRQGRLPTTPGKQSQIPVGHLWGPR